MSTECGCKRIGVRRDPEKRIGVERSVKEIGLSFGKTIVKDVPKVKVVAFGFNNSCLDENGRWQESGIDTSLVNDFYIKFSATKLTWLEKIEVTSAANKVLAMFNNASSLEWADVSDYDLSNISGTNGERMFSGASKINNIDVSRWNVSKMTSFWSFFGYCNKLTKLDLTNWDMRAATRLDGMFHSCKALVSLIGGKTIDEVLNNNISCLNGLKVFSSDTFANVTNLDRASLRALINGLADLTGETPVTLKLGATLMAKLTEEDIAIATNKNWTIA